jgi:hypothetical protein
MAQNKPNKTPRAQTTQTSTTTARPTTPGRISGMAVPPTTIFLVVVIFLSMPVWAGIFGAQLSDRTVSMFNSLLYAVVPMFGALCGVRIFGPKGGP